MSGSKALWRFVWVVAAYLVAAPILDALHVQQPWWYWIAFGFVMAGRE